MKSMDNFDKDVETQSALIEELTKVIRDSKVKLTKLKGLVYSSHKNGDTSYREAKGFINRVESLRDEYLFLEDEAAQGVEEKYQPEFFDKVRSAGLKLGRLVKDLKVLGIEEDQDE